MFCQLAPLDGLNKRKSVEPFVYCVGGSDKTQKQINNTPHLIGICFLDIYGTSDECHCLSMLFLKLSDFLHRIKAKHFHKTLPLFAALQR